MAKRTAPRIIGGKLGGARLRSPSGNITRPIMDRVKENLFNIIGFDIANTRFLDLFAGTGSVGIEAYSRGATFIQFVEKNQLPYTILINNLQLITEKKAFAIRKMDAFRFVDSFNGEAFDFIFIAPPQYKGLWKRAMVSIEKNPKILRDDGLIILQIDPIEFEEVESNSLRETDRRRYGSTLLQFFEKNLT